MAILATEKVLTLDYWKPAYKLQVGDYVFDRSGKLVKIKLIQEYRAEDCFEVQFDDALCVGGDANLGFLVETRKYRQRLCNYKGINRFRRPLAHTKIKDVIDQPLLTEQNRKLFSVPTTQPLTLPHQDLPIPPFVMGFWFFSKKSRSLYTASAKNFDFVKEKLRDYGYKTVHRCLHRTGKREFYITPSIDSHLAPNIPKQIPNNYLLASAEQRIELLSGVIMAKHSQYNEATDTFRVTSRHLPTVTQIQGLAESLGCKTKIHHNEYLKNYTLSFKTKHVLVPYQRSKPVKVHHARRYVTKISSIPAQLCVHIETTGQDNTILVGEGFISTC
jgi:hypothetical protein